MTKLMVLEDSLQGGCGVRVGSGIQRRDKPDRRKLPTLQ
jgi:hypothetical protein